MCSCWESALRLRAQGAAPLTLAAPQAAQLDAVLSPGDAAGGAPPPKGMWGLRKAPASDHSCSSQAQAAHHSRTVCVHPWIGAEISRPSWGAQVQAQLDRLAELTETASSLAAASAIKQAAPKSIRPAPPSDKSPTKSSGASAAGKKRAVLPALSQQKEPKKKRQGPAAAAP